MEFHHIVLFYFSIILIEFLTGSSNVGNWLGWDRLQGIHLHSRNLKEWKICKTMSVAYWFLDKVKTLARYSQDKLSEFIVQTYLVLDSMNESPKLMTKNFPLFDFLHKFALTFLHLIDNLMLNHQLFDHIRDYFIRLDSLNRRLFLKNFDWLWYL